MIERNPIVVVILMFVTCGFYSFYWNYVTTKELAAATGRTDLNLTTELLLNVVTCGLFGMYVAYRNQQIVDEWFKSKGIAHDPKAQMVGLMELLTFVAGATWIIATFIHQDELNKLAAQIGTAPEARPPVTF